jgi:hypothetical protein
MTRQNVYVLLALSLVCIPSNAMLRLLHRTVSSPR